MSKFDASESKGIAFRLVPVRQFEKLLNLYNFDGFISHEN